MHDERPARRLQMAPLLGIVLAVLFLGLGVAAFVFGGGPVVAAIAVAGGVLTLAASVFLLVRP